MWDNKEVLRTESVFANSPLRVSACFASTLSYEGQRPRQSSIAQEVEKHICYGKIDADVLEVAPKERNNLFHKHALSAEIKRKTQRKGAKVKRKTQSVRTRGSMNLFALPLLISLCNYGLPVSISANKVRVRTSFRSDFSRNMEQRTSSAVGLPVLSTP